MVVRVSAKTMPGKALSVERELRWRIKRALDEADILIVGGIPLQPEDTPTPDGTAGMAAPSAFGNTASPQSEAASPIASPGAAPAGPPAGGAASAVPK